MKTMRHSKKQVSKARTVMGRQRAVNTNCLWGSQMLVLLDKDFKVAFIKMFKELKEPMSKELKKSKRTMSCQIEKSIKR